MDREKIIRAIIKNRKDCKDPAIYCPFLWPEFTCKNSCAEIFLGWAKKVKFHKTNNWGAIDMVIGNNHPCHFYKKGMVKRRMKKLFPELYP